MLEVPGADGKGPNADEIRKLRELHARAARVATAGRSSAAGVFAQAAYSAILLGLPAIAPAIQDRYELSLHQVGVVLAAISFGSLATLLPWGIVADRIGERAVIAFGQTGTARQRWSGPRTRRRIRDLRRRALRSPAESAQASTQRAAAPSWPGSARTNVASLSGSARWPSPLGGAVAAVALPVLDQHISLRAAFSGWPAAAPSRRSSAASCCAAKPGGGTRRPRAAAARPTRLADLHREHVLRRDPDQPARLLRALPARSARVSRQQSRRQRSPARRSLAAQPASLVGRWSDRLRMRIVPLRWSRSASPPPPE